MKKQIQALNREIADLRALVQAKDALILELQRRPLHAGPAFPSPFAPMPTYPLPNTTPWQPMLPPYIVTSGSQWQGSTSQSNQGLTTTNVPNSIVSVWKA